MRLNLANAGSIIEDSTFLNNNATNGGGIYVGGEILIQRSTFTGNTASYYGGGIFSY